MKNPLIAAAAVMLPVSVLAQSGVAAYGIIDVSVEHLKFSGTATRGSSNLSTLTSDTSRLGFRGTEDLGDGRRAYFKIETGLQMDTGAQTSGTAFWNRETYVGLGDARWGSVQLGSQFAPGLVMSLKADPFTRFGLGGQYTLLQGLRGYQNRFDNVVQYVSPTIAGISGRLLVAAGESAATGRSYAAFLEYTGGPLYLGAVYDQVKTTAASVGLAGSPVGSRTVSLAVTYDFKVAKLYGWVQSNRIDSLDKANGYMVGTTVPLGQGELRASYAHRDAPDADASLLAIGYAHFLSRRTQIYATVGRLENSGSAAFRMGPATGEQAAARLPAAGQDTSGMQLGMRHTF